MIASSLVRQTQTVLSVPTKQPCCVHTIPIPDFDKTLGIWASEQIKSLTHSPYTEGVVALLRVALSMIHALTQAIGVVGTAADAARPAETRRTKPVFSWRKAAKYSAGL